MEDYLPVYPSLNSPDIQKIITRKKEFQELAALRDESLPTGGGFYNHQKFFVRFMIMADRVINIHEPGTGKTCAFVAAAEHFKGTGSYKRTYIIEKSGIMIQSIRSQIIESCAPGVYDSTVTNESGLTRRSIRGRIKKALDEWYKFKTYKRFAIELSRMDDKEIINKYSKSIIILDEVHNILSTSPGGKETDDSKDYPFYLRLCRLIRQSKICAVTATPMVNDTAGVVKLINLLLPEGQEMPKDVDNLTLAQMEPFFRGKITFVRSSTKAATPLYMGDILPATYEMTFPDDSDLNQSLRHQARMITRNVKSGIRVFLSPMGDIQERQYLSIPYAPFEGKNITAGIFTFPFGTDSDFIKSSRGGRYSWTTPPGFSTWNQRGKFVSFHQWLYNNGDTSNLGRLSGKMKAIIDIERPDTGAPGFSFIYTHLRNFSGAITIAMIFTLFGFEFFNDNLEQVFTTEDSNEVKELYPKKPRVAVFSSGFSQSKQEAILKLVRSEANVNGEYIKVLIGSRTSRDGLNVYHCRRMHLISPQWNFSGMIQAINRVLRAQSHEALKKYLHKEATKLRLTGEAYDRHVNFNVEIYRHCIDYQIKDDSNNVSLSVSGEERTPNIDLYMYRHAEQKEINIRRVFRAMKICAVDAIVNRARNILSNDWDYSQECDYEPCDYPSWEQLRDRGYNPDYELSRPELVDTETYDVLYRDTNRLKESILKRLLRSKSVSYLKIFQEYREKGYEDETIIRTLNDIREMTSERIITKDGDRLFIVLGDNGIHLQRQIDMPTFYVRDLSIYEFPNMSLINRQVSDIFTKMEQSTVEADLIAVSTIYNQNEVPLMEDLRIFKKGASRKTIDQVVNYIEGLPEWRRKSLLEDFVVNLKGNDIFLNAKVTENILKIFKGYYFQFSEVDPVTDRPFDVYVHIFQSHGSKGKSHNIVARNRDPKEFRIYKSNETLGWRRLIEGEDKYKDMVVKKIAADKEPYSKYPVYGIILQDKRFRVHYNPPNSDLDAIVDKRQLRKGIDCKSLQKYELINIAWDEQIYPPMTNIAIPKNEQDMRDSLEGTFGRDFIKTLTGAKLQLMYMWNHQPDIARVICELLKEKLYATDRIYSPYMLY